MNELKSLRDKIDKIDEELLNLISKRINLVLLVGAYKARKKLKIVDKERELEKITSLVALGKKIGVDKKTIVKIWNTLFNVSYELEK